MDLTYCFNKIFNEGTLDEALAKTKNSQKMSSISTNETLNTVMRCSDALNIT